MSNKWSDPENTRFFFGKGVLLVHYAHKTQFDRHVTSGRKLLIFLDQLGIYNGFAGDRSCLDIVLGNQLQ